MRHNTVDELVQVEGKLELFFGQIYAMAGATEEHCELLMAVASDNYADTAGYVYLGSCQTKKSLYKLQFRAMEYFDGNQWDRDILKSKQQVRLAQ